MNSHAQVKGEDQSVADTTAGGEPAWRYWAFLSYSHRDSKVADQLHKQLEKFRVPDSLVGQPHPLGTIPKYVKPIFRDRHELAAASSLSREIDEALAQSRYLIVLCSPAAAASRWVDDEVRRFKHLHGEDRVLAAIIEGEPFSDEAECFPPALRFRVGRNGKLTRDKVEPIAADLREDRDGPRIGALKIAAGMLEVGLDDLVQRDQQRRNRRARWIVAASLVGMVFTTGLSVVAINARNAAQEERRAAESLVGFMLGDLKDQLEPIGKLEALDQVGARALAYYGRQNQKELTDDQLAQRSRALTLLGQIALARGDRDAALARYREALRGTGELVERATENPQRLFDHAQNVFWLGELARDRGQLQQAEESYRVYLGLAQRMVAADPNNTKWQMELLYAKENIGIALLNQRRFAEAAAIIDEALPAMRAIARASPDNEIYAVELSKMLAWLGDARRDEGKLDPAIEARREQIDFLRSRVALNAGNVQLRAELIPAHNALGLLLSSRNQLVLAADQHRLAEVEADRLTAIEPDNASWQGLAAGASIELSKMLLSLNQISRARETTEAACTQAAQLISRDATVSSWQAYATACQMLRAQLARADGRNEEAVSLAQQALRSAKNEKSGDTNRDRYRIASVYRQLGDIQQKAGEGAEARLSWNAGLALLPTISGERPRELAERAALLNRLGRLAELQPVRDRLRAAGITRVE